MNCFCTQGVYNIRISYHNKSHIYYILQSIFSAILSLTYIVEDSGFDKIDHLCCSL